MLTLQQLRHSSSTFRTHHPKPPASLRAAPRSQSCLHCLSEVEGEREGEGVVMAAAARLVRRLQGCQLVLRCRYPGKEKGEWGQKWTWEVEEVEVVSQQSHHLALPRWAAPTPCLPFEHSRSSTLACRRSKMLPSLRAAPWAAPVAGCPSIFHCQYPWEGEEEQRQGSR